MKRFKSLKFHVSVKFILVILILSALLLIFLPLGLKSFFLEESYKTIEQAQKVGNMPMNHQTQVNPKTVNHILVTYQNNEYILSTRMKQVNSQFVQEAIEKLKIQKSDTVRYEYLNDKVTIYYVINKTDDLILISFVYASYVDYYIDALLQQLLIIIIIVVILSFIIGIFIANSITKPLITISQKIKSLAINNWEEPIPVTRQDEIGDIQQALESMRQHLKKQDKFQRGMFQNISHDLKTPIMIIEGYSKSIMDGYVANEEIYEVSKSILEESKRLEKKVKSLLYINKIEQLSLEKQIFLEIDTLDLIHTVVLPFEKQYPNIKFKIKITEVIQLKGEFEQWRIALENIIENMIRYAKNLIEINVYHDTIKIYNDGEPIEQGIMDRLFIPYGVGLKSNSGLGLAITHKILAMYGFNIIVHNTEQGVEFIISKINL